MGKIFLFVLVATILEVTGDAIIRKCLYEYNGIARVAMFFLASALLIGYGISINLAPIEFSKVAGLYIATLFVVWQTVNYLFFKTIPTTPIILGGILIVAGGLIVTFWER